MKINENKNQSGITYEYREAAKIYIIVAFVMFVVIGCIVLLSGCNNSGVNDNTYTIEDYCNMRLVCRKGDSRIYVDKNTGVLYYVKLNGYRYGITPIYNADGTLKIYEGENRYVRN